eukprot:TRINITY_DN6270_c0_g1_i1.p1 TRINITY_DN6270_c0_g1~~TRINITY_DN6270_c0_g1_i1.p1  ORF type:complete len:179 (-),score=46.80 TRINITY_DN6270_c0_g1_i1:116-652(-)
MACGFGMAAVRSLSKKMPATSFSLRRRMRSQGSACKYKPMEEEEVTEQQMICNRSTTFEDAANEWLLEGAVHADEASEGDSVEMAGRTQTLQRDCEFPDVSAYLDPEVIQRYNKLYLAEADDSDAASNDASTFSDDSDADEMYSGPLEPCRTRAHRDFPDPAKYLTKKELAELWSSFA